MVTNNKPSRAVKLGRKDDKMIILATGKETSIVVSEKDIERGVKNFYTLYNNALYDPRNLFKPIEQGKHKLFDRPRAEYSELEKVATIEFDRKPKQCEAKTAAKQATTISREQEITAKRNTSL